MYKQNTEVEQLVSFLQRAYTWPRSNWRPSACEADVIATRPQVPWSCVWNRTLKAQENHGWRDVLPPHSSSFAREHRRHCSCAGVAAASGDAVARFGIAAALEGHSGRITPGSVACCMYTWPGSNWRPSACEADVIATRPQVLVVTGSTAGFARTAHPGTGFTSPGPVANL